MVQHAVSVQPSCSEIPLDPFLRSRVLSQSSICPTSVSISSHDQREQKASFSVDSQFPLSAHAELPRIVRSRLVLADGTESEVSFIIVMYSIFNIVF